MSEVHGRAGHIYDISKLPKWAQDHIETLGRNLAYAKERLEAGPENSDTFAGPYDDSPRPLGEGVMVRFGGLGYERTFDVCFRDGELAILANAGRDEMVIKPRTETSVRMTFVERQRS